MTFSVQNTDASYLQMADVNANVESKSSKKDVFLWSLSNRPQIYFPDAIIFQVFFFGILLQSLYNLHMLNTFLSLLT